MTIAKDSRPPLLSSSSQRSCVASRRQPQYLPNYAELHAPVVARDDSSTSLSLEAGLPPRSPLCRSYRGGRGPSRALEAPRVERRLENRAARRKQMRNLCLRLGDREEWLALARNIIQARSVVRWERSRMVQALVGEGAARRAPSTRVLEAAESTHRALGHENLGFLSAQRGFMPLAAPELRLPPEFAVWDEVASELPRLYGSLRVRQTIDRLPHLGARVAELPERSLLRACNVLAILSHAYQYVETEPPGGQPLVLSEPWAAVRQRLGRPDEVLTYIDLIVYSF